VGTAVRDAVGFIHFSQFTNQLDYADVATALNNHVRDSVVQQAVIDSAVNRSITFEGAFQLLDPNRITVTPVRLKVAS
jgi:predicted lipoprotein